MIKSVAIVGFGSFGTLLAEILAPHVEVRAFSRRSINAEDIPSGVSMCSISEAAACDLIILANDLAGLKASCEAIAPYVTSKTVVMDVCSVKTKPARILEAVLSDKCKLLLTHPLFGPQSYANNGGTEGLRIVWHDQIGGPFPEIEDLFSEVLGLKILKISPDDHDKDMAWVHALTFFVGRGLLNLDPPETPLATHYYKELMDLVSQEKQHSYELFMTVQQGNPYADQIRKRFVDSLEALESKIVTGSISVNDIDKSHQTAII